MADLPPTSPAGPTIEPPPSERDRIIEAFLQLLAVESFEEIGFSQIATRAELTLGAVRKEFGSKLAILAAFVREVDRKVLDGSEADMADEPARERLFDVLMRRIEVLSPHKEAVRSLMRSAQRDPCLALALNSMTVQSMQWMLTAADIRASGTRGMVRAQGLALLYARVLQTFVHDDDPGHARTMAALDNALGRGARWADFLDGACRVAFAPWRLFGGFSRRRRPRSRDDMEDTVAA
jgi:AcrR family transcriptional regulator